MRALLTLLPMLLATAGANALPLPTAPTAIEPNSENASGQTHDLKLARDAYDRMTVSVRIGDSGPYRFLVDTGAERTVISRQLAQQLGLAAGARARLHSVAGASDVATVDIPALQVSARRFDVAGAPTLESINIGADGMLGVDSLAMSQILFDFRRGVMGITPSRGARMDDPDTIVVEARRRHGRLMFTQADVDGRGTVVVIDTGSQITIGNPELRRRLIGRRPVGEMIEIYTVVGEKITAEIYSVRALGLGGVTLTDMKIAFIDSPVFRQLELDGRPALLLGMNALRGFDKVSIDFATRRVHFVLPGSSMSNHIEFAAN